MIIESLNCSTIHYSRIRGKYIIFFYLHKIFIYMLNASKAVMKHLKYDKANKYDICIFSKYSID